jgi:hypothetical protein
MGTGEEDSDCKEEAECEEVGGPKKKQKVLCPL